MFSTSELVRRRTRARVDKYSHLDEHDVTSKVVGKVTKRECQQINDVLMASTAIPGNLDAVPEACTIPAPGDAPLRHLTSHGMKGLARRATKWTCAVDWPENSVLQSPEDHVTGGDITAKECVVLAKHLALNFATDGLLPRACRSVVNKVPASSSSSREEEPIAFSD